MYLAIPHLEARALWHTVVWPCHPRVTLEAVSIDRSVESAFFACPSSTHPRSRARRSRRSRSIFQAANRSSSRAATASITTRSNEQHHHHAHSGRGDAPQQRAVAANLAGWWRHTNPAHAFRKMLGFSDASRRCVAQCWPSGPGAWPKKHKLGFDHLPIRNERSS